MGTFRRVSVPLATAVLLTGSAAAPVLASATPHSPPSVEADAGVSAKAASAKAVSAKAGSMKAGETVKLKKSKYGKILVDGKGRTLYLFEKDKRNKSDCKDDCATAWPPMTVKNKARAGKGVMKSELKTVKRDKGEKQVTYHGHPLYRFEEDRKPGQTNGQGVDQFGAKWYVVDAKGKAVLHERKDGSPDPGEGDGGY
ncbi:hypothetical protein HLB32_06435 [Streptomyces cacaoi]|uniref:Lipoprotein n=2 Tax=Streptomyces TaxID=1883 RepID=A0A4Y3QW81_STRCI|nr:hypothetical protein [Streptomyces cacaoi]GEB49654.1 lipoprotein [Streptomyces cacaoi]